jgi:membrane protein DedA with SNARE-associated domain
VTHALEQFIRHYGLLAIFAAMILESCCIPIPSELIMAYAGFAAYEGSLNFAAAVVTGVAGNLLGSLLAYYIGS